MNPEKCAFSKITVKFLGHLIDENGIQADPDKTVAILKMEPPRNVPELRRFMGMANQLGKFSHRLAELNQPLRELLSSKRSWVWGPDQERAFADVQAELAQPTVLALYDLKQTLKFPLMPHLASEQSSCSRHRQARLGSRWPMRLVR